MKAKRSGGKGYNIKLPRNFRDRFSRPYDKFLNAILSYSDMLTPEIMLTSGNQIYSGPKDWLVWLNDEDRNQFKRIKESKMPKTTHPQFINALLLIYESEFSKPWPGVDNNGVLQSQIVPYRPTSKTTDIIIAPPVVGESDNLNSARPKLWELVNNDRLLPPIATYRRTSKVFKHSKTPSYKINGIELL
jgi:hypothetical protein